MHVYPLPLLRRLCLGLLLLLLLLTDDLAGVVFHQHGAVGLQLFYGDGEAEVVQKEELEFQVIELDEGEAANLRSGRLVDVRLKRLLRRFDGVE